jgi:NADP-dependent 3-hydroxy acid dehydrogenase YdfG
VDAFVDGAAGRFGRIDGLVNNTGAGVSVDSLDITEEQFARTFDFNARSTFFCSQRAARHMVATGGGVIVNISSNFAVAGVGVRSVYCAAKALDLPKSPSHDERINVCNFVANPTMIAPPTEDPFPHDVPQGACRGESRLELSTTQRPAC